MSKFEHISVLRNELVAAMILTEGSLVVDCTAGGGGHTAEILKLIGKSGKVLAFDRDITAIKVLNERFHTELAEGRIEIIHGKFSSLRDNLESRQLLGKINAVCADIGVSSPQLDEGERGFSFSKDGPLDMRMDQSQKISAADLVNFGTEAELLRIFREYGEDPQAKPIVRAILKQRSIKPVTRTLELADLVAATVRYKERSRKHPATKVFQALRIAVNAELDELSLLLQTLPEVVRPGGRVAIISFHSLEDRLVKLGFRELSEGKRALIDRHLPVTARQLARLEERQFCIIKPFPLVPSEEELSLNPRSRSAKLRVIERLDEGV